MWIKTAWVDEDDAEDGPYMVTAVDEWTYDLWQGDPDWYKAEVAKYRNVRELYVRFSDNAIVDLFKPGSVVAAPDAVSEGGS